MSGPVLSIWKGEIPRNERMIDIATRIAGLYGVTLDDLKGRSQARMYSDPRLHAYAAIYATGRFSTTQIGRFFGRDHSTVSDGIRAHNERMGEAA